MIRIACDYNLVVFIRQLFYYIMYLLHVRAGRVKHAPAFFLEPVLFEPGYAVRRYYGRRPFFYGAYLFHMPCARLFKAHDFLRIVYNLMQ